MQQLDEAKASNAESVRSCPLGFSRTAHTIAACRLLLKGSWDLVTRVINKVPILIITYNPN